MPPSIGAQRNPDHVASRYHAHPLEGDANGARHRDASSTTKILGQIHAPDYQWCVGHNLPQEALNAFAEAVADVAEA
jgi:hypothetical protein